MSSVILDLIGINQFLIFEPLKIFSKIGTVIRNRFNRIIGNREKTIPFIFCFINLIIKSHNFTPQIM